MTDTTPRESPGRRIAVFGSVAAAPRRPRQTAVERARSEQRRLERDRLRPRPAAQPARGVS